MRRRPGPQPKGDRAAFTVRAPSAHMSAYRELAAAEGIPLGDYLARELARRHGLPDPGYLTRANRDQAALPLGA